MSEEFEEDELEYEEGYDYSNQSPLKNKYETGEVKIIQKEIQLVTKKIEREKIKLRITDERLEAKKKQYNQLQGKPVQKTDEEKERDHQIKLSQTREHKLETVPKPRNINKAEEFRLTQKKQFAKINKQESELETLTKTINETQLKIEDLKFEISNLRKRKVAYEKQLDRLILTNEEIKEETDKLKTKNEKGFEKIEKKDMQKLNKIKEEGVEQEKDFQIERNGLEDEYHKIIEANIQRERERNRCKLLNSYYMLFIYKY